MDIDPTDNEVEFTVAPYQFEPVLDEDDTANDEESEGMTSEEETESDNADQIRPVDQWCECGNCEQMSTALECRCCCGFNLCHDKMEQNNLQCITQHEGFQVNCLNRHVLELAFYEYLDNHGPIGDEEPVHELYRYIAYRRFARWLWHILGRKNRKVLPSCVVQKIRQTFPSDEYTGFKYARDYLYVISVNIEINLFSSVEARPVALHCFLDIHTICTRSWQRRALSYIDFPCSFISGEIFPQLINFIKQFCNIVYNK